MTTRTWFGGTGNFENPQAWTPTGVPAPGDTALIGPGTADRANIVRLTGERIDGVTILLNDLPSGSASPSPFMPTLKLHNVQLGSSAIIGDTTIPNGVGAGGTAIIDLKGFVANAGEIS